MASVLLQDKSNIEVFIEEEAKKSVLERANHIHTGSRAESDQTEGIHEYEEVKGLTG